LQQNEVREEAMDRTPLVQAEEMLSRLIELISGLLLAEYRQQVAEYDLTLLQAQALRVVRPGAMPIGRLAIELGLKPSAVTQLTDRLVRKGLIERRAATDDRRSVIVGLSSEGEHLIGQFHRRRGELLTGALAQLNRNEQLQVIEVIGRVVRAIEESET
jgi:DNA-binding MarR family transcriptional regulator